MNTTSNQPTPDADPLAAIPGADQGTLAAVRTRLAERAATEGILDIAYRMLDTPVGTLLLAATEHGLVRVAFPGQGRDAVLGALADQISSRILHSPGRLDPVSRELDEYFAGTRREFDLSLDRQLSSGFRGTVLRQLAGIGYGHTASYQHIARMAGSPKAARAVGTACATNPLPLVVPCHRVIHSDGGIGSYAGGADVKAMLLNLEQTGAPNYSVSRR